MKSIIYFAKSLLLTLALLSSAAVVAQTYEQSLAAYKREDYKIAFAGFKKLAEQGNAEAQYQLSLMHRRGNSVPEDDQQAVVWSRKAAEQGFAAAQFNIGTMYFIAILNASIVAKKQSTGVIGAITQRGASP